MMQIYIYEISDGLGMFVLGFLWRKMDFQQSDTIFEKLSKIGKK